ncbi:MAG TPA: FecR domain-containing protein [Desulfatiglandales bacterium]|nr:FecR domain-containing protein [Desulfatiglandales bacterium]
MYSWGKYNRFYAVLFIISLFIILSAPAFAAVDPVARLSAFSGSVLIKSQGEWGVKPVEGLPLYSDDKIVTRAGLATITFDDGAVMELKNNSNLLIYKQEKEEGLLRKTRVVQRRLRLMVGKMLFKTGTSNSQNILETPTMVCGLRGTAGTLSIASDGTPYIQFTEGGASYTIGDFISGIAEDVPEALANLNPAQRAAFVAAAAANQAQNAAALAAKAAGTPEEAKANAQAAYNAAKAAELAAEEVIVQAEIIARENPDTELAAQAEAVIQQADQSANDARESQQQAIDKGAVQEAPGTYQLPAVPEAVPTPGFDVPVTPDVPITDTEPASPV